jgi:hypothetical protein
MRLQIITAMYRFDNFHELRETLIGQGVDLRWTLLVENHERSRLQVDPNDSWIQVKEISFPPLYGFSHGDYKDLQYLRNGGSGDGEYCGFLNDDDSYEPGLLKAIAEQTTPVVVVSMLRGQQIPANAQIRHPAYTLFADPGCMCGGGVGLEQFFFTGSVVREVGILSDPQPEYSLIRLAQRGPTTYLRDRYVWFNYLEPGRWNRTPKPVAHRPAKEGVIVGTISAPVHQPKILPGRRRKRPCMA